MQNLKPNIGACKQYFKSKNTAIRATLLGMQYLVQLTRYSLIIIYPSFLLYLRKLWRNYPYPNLSNTSAKQPGS